MILLGLTSLAVSLTDMKPYMHLQLVPHMTKYRQVRWMGFPSHDSSGVWESVPLHSPTRQSYF